ncbi:Pol polyprotein [Plakobranchus ocellatus]|uniref:Pol polyprotein n=1 Tax=Plakobranchus ocellatus TaxID=259542 RepID=A0AAV3Y7X7_9GAST|nr:Pol polyprotein [Plakobranchus ocellatus]
MQNLILEKIHEGHQGIEKCQLRARNSVFWIGITKDIRNKVKCCEICEQHSKSQVKQPLMQHEIPTQPFEKLAADIFHLDGQDFLSSTEQIKHQLLERQKPQKKHFDKNTRDLPPLTENQQVSVQNATTGLWSPATIIKSSDEPRSYIIETPEGTTLRRIRRHLKDSGKTRQLEPGMEPDMDDPGECNT